MTSPFHIRLSWRNPSLRMPNVLSRLYECARVMRCNTWQVSGKT